MKGDMENHPKAWSSRLVRSNITLFLRLTSQGLHQSGKKVPGIVLVSLFAGGIWRVMVEDMELENLDASEIHARRLHAKGIAAKNGERFMFPNRRWYSKIVKRSWNPKIHNIEPTCKRRSAQW